MTSCLLLFTPVDRMPCNPLGALGLNPPTLAQHDDDVAFFQGLFVRGDAAACQRLMHPSLRMASPPTLHVPVRPSGDPGSVFALEVPLCTLTLQSHTMLLMDNHCRQFLWVGADVSEPGTCYGPVLFCVHLIISPAASCVCR
jgi:hypothetical protein